MENHIISPIRTEFLFSILVHLCIISLFSIGMDTFIEKKKSDYISVELISLKRGRGGQPATPKLTDRKPEAKPIQKPEEPLPEKPKYTEYSEEEPVTEYREDHEQPGQGEEGEGGDGGSPFGTVSGEVRYEPFHRVSVLPSFKVQAEPAYPPSERAAGKETQVVAEVYIGENGTVDRVEIITSGGILFDNAVISAVKNSSFTPAFMDGKPVAVRVKIPYTFKLR